MTPDSPLEARDKYQQQLAKHQIFDNLAILRENVKDGPRTQWIGVLVSEIERALVHGGIPSVRFLEESERYVDWKKLDADRAGKPRLALQAEMTDRGNMSVRVVPVKLKENGHFSKAPEWGNLRYDRNEAFSRPENECLFLHGIEFVNRWIVSERPHERPVGEAAAMAVIGIFAIEADRLRREFGIEVASSPYLDPSDGDQDRFRAVDNLRDRYVSLSEEAGRCLDTYGVDPSIVIDAALDARSREVVDVAVSVARKMGQHGADIRPGAVRDLLPRLEQAIRYRVWNPSVGIPADPDRVAEEAIKRERPFEYAARVPALAPAM